MGKIWLWGAGNNFEKVKNCLYRDVKIEGIIDGNRELEYQKRDGLRIYFPSEDIFRDNDTIVITPQKYEDIYGFILDSYSAKALRVIPFWCGTLDDDVTDIIDVQKRKMMMDISEMKTQIYYMNLVLQNAQFELAEKIMLNPPVLPEILSGEEALKISIAERKSICRFGDGEFEIIFGRERPIFQNCRNDLKERLKEVLGNKEKSVITCIADNYGCLDKYSDMGAYAIRHYMTLDTRKRHMEVIDLKKKYYDAYISRPYIIYKDKERAANIFALWKSLWRNRDVVIVEGNWTRNGYGNDLFEECRSIKRILCPAENAWDSYREIYHYITDNIEKDKLLLISLGPTATVLAYDLAISGYQAIDIGHLDNEYEWYLRGVNERVDISYKCVPECSNGTHVTEVDDATYDEQILAYIACGKNEGGERENA